MSIEDVQDLLGRPTKRSQRTEGALTLQTLTFQTQDELIEAHFVDGVLVRYSVSSR